MSTGETSSTEKLASALAGSLVTSLLMTPLDVVKFRIQTQAHTKSQAPCCQLTTSPKAVYCTWTHPITHNANTQRPIRLQQHIASLHECTLGYTKQPFVLRGTLDGMYKIFRYEGASALWKGLSPVLLMSIPGNMIYFVGYDHLRDSIQKYTSPAYQEYSPLVAGAMARTIAVATIAPIELFRTRLQSATGAHSYKSVLQGVQKMVQQSGWLALWQGFPPTLWRDVPFSAIYWMGYEQTKLFLTDHQTSWHPLQISFLSGVASGLLAAAVTTPFDVLKTHRQVDDGKIKDHRMLTLMKQVYGREGIQGLFRGLGPRLAKVAPSCGIMISSYELGKSFFSQHHHQ
ncbi:mitochondrial carrier [Hesseltinella vesiculosa]|uniref:Mitochondrial carrier n=1 Tax=Hesseltinella vesiculosa TaxID=101127 RepID=A0A1X2GPV2_9FUNG|nr:mitochondrial carrier [Hesseltinella vesiculosa]